MSIIKISDIYKLDNSSEDIKNVINSNFLSFRGEYINKCENKLKEILNVKYVILTNNGTSATHCIIKSIKYKYPKCNKIYVPNNCYIAIYNVILMEFDKKNIEIIPIDDETFNIDLNYLNILEKNSALVLLHNLGNIINIDLIKKMRPDLILVEDNCEGFYGKYNSKFSGTNTLCSSISFFCNKHITCGEGGAFITNDLETYKHIKKFCYQGITDKKYIHDIMATNYRLSNLNASILFNQLCLLQEIYDIKSKYVNMYKILLEDVPYITFQKEEKNTKHSNWIFSVKIETKLDYNLLEQFFCNYNIEIRPFFYDFRVNEHLKKIKYIGKIEEKKYTIILLPLHCNLKEKDITYICNVLKSININEY